MAKKKEYRLAARFNFFIILMILLTSFCITLFVIMQQRSSGYEELLNRGISLADIISKNSDYSLFTEDRKSLQQLADSTLTDSNVAYVAIMNADRRILVSKTRDNDTAMPPAGSYPRRGGRIAAEKIAGGKDGSVYVDIIAPVMSVSTGDLAALGGEANTGPKTIGYVRIGLTQEGLKRRLRTFLLSTLLFTSLLAGVGAAAAFFITRRITSPIKHLVAVAEAISRGKLRHSIKREGAVEIASLAGAIDDMSTHLKDMMFKIIGLASGVSSVTQTITESPASVLRVADTQRSSVEKTISSIAEMDKSIASVSISSDTLYHSAEETSAAALEMTASVSGVAENASIFHETAKETAAAVEQMISAITEISGSLDVLSSASEDTLSALGEIQSSSSLIRQHSEESVRLAELVSTVSSDKGISAMDTAIRGIEEARRKVDLLSSSMQDLGNRSAEIGAIITVIDDVADQTNLLALNAAIIAAQAGRNGSAFTVVAEEIKSLAERASVSTGEISNLITSVQSDTEASVKMAMEGIRAVDEGVKLVREAKGALYHIIETSRSSTEMSRAIEGATAKEADAVMSIGASIRNQTAQVDLISAAMRDQSERGIFVIDAMEKVRTLADHLLCATGEQLKFSKRISQVAEQVSGQAEQITSAIRSQKLQSRDIVAISGEIRKTTADLIASAEEMNASILSLSGDAQQLMAELGKFET